eukprot:COSAG02_NODE_3452_length_6717_cov_11.574645_5_plen_196_part_00
MHSFTSTRNFTSNHRNKQKPAKGQSRELYFSVSFHDLLRDSTTNSSRETDRSHTIDWVSGLRFITSAVSQPFLSRVQEIGVVALFSHPPYNWLLCVAVGVDHDAARNRAGRRRCGDARPCGDEGEARCSRSSCSRSRACSSSPRRRCSRSSRSCSLACCREATDGWVGTSLSFLLGWCTSGRLRGGGLEGRLLGP